jgi:hypothetical protein
MTQATPQARGPGRPRTYSKLVAIRIPQALAARLARRLVLLEIKGDMKNRTNFILESLTKNLDTLDRADKRNRRKKRSPRS